MRGDARKDAAGNGRAAAERQRTSCEGVAVKQPERESFSARETAAESGDHGIARPPRALSTWWTPCFAAMAVSCFALVAQ
jgi:hypothetical protein